MTARPATRDRPFADTLIAGRPPIGSAVVFLALAIAAALAPGEGWSAEAAPAAAEPAVAGQPSEAAKSAPAASPKPKPPSEKDLAFYPPLSIEEAIELCRRAEDLLAAPVDSFPDRRREGARRMVASAKEFCEFLDNRHSTLASYRWYRLPEVKAPTSGRDTVEVRLPTPVESVSAISFTSSGGDVFVWSMTLVDPTGQKTEFPDVRTNVPWGLPRTALVHLQRPSRVQRIEADLSQRADQTARLSFYAGVTRDPEHAKKAIAQMAEAIKTMDALDRGDGGDLGQPAAAAKAVEDLQAARANMALFEKRLERNRQRRRGP